MAEVGHIDLMVTWKYALHIVSRCDLMRNVHTAIIMAWMLNTSMMLSRA